MSSPSNFSLIPPSYVDNSVIISVLIIFQIPSIICALFVLYQFIIKRELYEQLHNYAVFVLLVCSTLVITTELPISLNYLIKSIVYPQIPGFCLFWGFWYFTTTDTLIVFMAWTSVQRHLFIFNPNVFRTKRGRLIYHYIPSSICLLYIPFMIIIFMFINPCNNTFNYMQFLCGYPCFFQQTSVVTFHLIVNLCVPTSFTIIAILSDVN
ncbi:unnamed protein product [Didymodactylos carnosus]|uniref:G-protein coupled receptors family 1 profile domain-containing protein n=1 Tax=Didymodactylos carnosus TaxID=1234261 RepID=A0A815D3A2_9BILA|nr:unnamed protein product [Didymodactylos carnosus]CAF4098798.1 unnamed protein product [Didymodactylos carnosus]